MSTELINIGDMAIYVPGMKGLPLDSVGIVSGIINEQKVSVTYPQYCPTEENGKYKFTPHIYVHSANINDLKLVNNE